MMTSRILLLLLLSGVQGAACAQPARGVLLYETHCIACHSTEIHWRKKHLATNWSSLLVQVQHWQATQDLHWSTDEITDVAHYLNTHYYGFLEPAHKGYSEDKRIDHSLR